MVDRANVLYIGRTLIGWRRRRSVESNKSEVPLDDSDRPIDDGR